MTATAHTIEPADRSLAVCTHLSGFAGYFLPLGGVIVPIVIWMVKSESAVIAGVAKQALLLNLIVYVLAAASFVLFLTVILIPLVILFWIALGIFAVALPIVGAIKASEGEYYRYPVIGLPPG